jgi:transposase
MRRALLQAFAAQLRNDDVVVIEATDNAAAVAEVIGPHVKRVVIANPKQVRLIAHAKIKMDKIDAAVLAQLYASGFLPEVWIADPRTQKLRRQVTRRNQIVRQRSRLKNVIQPILHAHLIPPCPAANVFNRKGRAWLEAQPCRRTNVWQSNATCGRSTASARICRASSAILPGMHWPVTMSND